MIAIVVFAGAIFFIYAIFNANQGDGAKELETDASKVLESVASEDPNVGIVEGIEVEEAKLQQLLGEDYNATKEKSNVLKLISSRNMILNYAKKYNIKIVLSHCCHLRHFMLDMILDFFKY